MLPEATRLIEALCSQPDTAQQHDDPNSIDPGPGEGRPGLLQHQPSEYRHILACFRPRSQSQPSQPPLRATYPQRLHHFLHPESGKRIYVASSPEEAAKLREAQAHHEDRREALRNEHAEVYDRFAHVHDELNALSLELDRVATQGVS